MIEGIKMLEVGAQAPDFRIKDANGVTFHYAKEKGEKSVLMVFWSIFCEPCRAEMPFIQKMYEKYKGNGLDVVSIALDGEPLKNSIVGFIKQEGYTFRILIDELDTKEMFKAADPYGVAGTPTIYLLAGCTRCGPRDLFPVPLRHGPRSQSRGSRDPLCRVWAVG
jgi:peroxiredoxin